MCRMLDAIVVLIVIRGEGVVLMRGAVRMHMGCQGGVRLMREARQLQCGGHALQRQDQQQEASNDEAETVHGSDFRTIEAL